MNFDKTSMSRIGANMNLPNVWVKVFGSVENGAPVYSQRRVTEYQRVWLEDHCIEYACC